MRCRKQPLNVAVALIPAVVALAAAATLADPTQHLEMFLDDANIASAAGVARELQQPDRLPDPVITGGGRWDTSPSFGTVIYDRDENLYKAWYQMNGGGNNIAYATSADGRNWDYPYFDIITYDYKEEHYPETNMLIAGHGFTRLYNAAVIKDDADPDPSRRYKIVYSDIGPHTGTLSFYNNGGLFTRTSPDGIHWSDASPVPALPAAKVDQSISDVAELIYDSQKGKYVIYGKGWDWRGGGANPSPDHRQIVRAESSDFINWSTPQVVVTHDNTPADPQSYGASVFEYEGVYVMLLRSYKDTGIAAGNQGDQTIDVQLATSRDGVNWTRVADKATFMPVGAPDTWDDGMVFPYNPIIGKNGDIEIFYQGWDGRHDLYPGEPKRTSKVGLATLDPGRFVAMVAEGDGVATITTTSFVANGQPLLVNADLGDTGSIRVAVLTAAGQTLADYTHEQSSLTARGELYHAVAWDDADFAALHGTGVALRFYLEGDARLYGYTTAPQFAPEPAAALLWGAAGAGIFARRARADTPASSQGARHDAAN